MAAGDELLIADANERHRQGIRKLFEQAGYVCTAVGTRTDTERSLEQKFFPVAVIDLDVDVERPAAGIDLVRYTREHSPATAVVVVAGRRSYEGAVEAFRTGAHDVVLKERNQLQHLRHTVDSACDRVRAGRNEGTSLFREVRDVLDESFRVMLALAREVYRDVSVGSMQSFNPRVLVVDGNQEFLQGLAQQVADKPWETVAEMSGGAALDKAGSQGFDLVAARDELMDLKGTMVVRTIQANRAESIGLVYSDEAGGRLERYVQGRSEHVDRPFGGLDHLMRSLQQAVDELGSTQADRAVIQAFRREHGDFLRRFAEIKMRIGRMLG